MSTNKIMNSYDDTKKMLNKIRQIQEMAKPKYGVIKEQIDSEDGDDFSSLQKSTTKYMETNQPQSGVDTEHASEGENMFVINGVEIEINSEDPQDWNLTDEEKGKITQLIDDFRAEVSETTEFGKMLVYESSAKLNGKIGDIGLEFTLSTGDDNGLYIQGAMLKIDDNSLGVINKLKIFQSKYGNTINDLLVTRRMT